MANVVKRIGKPNGLAVTHQGSFAKPTTQKYIPGGPAHHAKMRRASGKGQMR